MRIVLSGRAINGPSVELKALGTLVTGNHKGQVIHAISLPQNSMKDGNQPWMRKDGLEHFRFFAPFQDPAQVLSSWTSPSQSSALESVAKRIGCAFNHLAGMRVDDIIANLDFLWGQNSPHNEVPIQIK
jgi:hypothetical protein